MKFSVLGWIGAIGCAMLVSEVSAQHLRQPLSVKPIGFNYDYYAQEGTAVSPSDQDVPEVASADEAESVADVVGNGVAPGAHAVPMMAPSCGCDPACDGSCDSCGGGGGGLFSGCSLLGDCGELGDPWTLSEYLCGCDPCVTVGGWLALGYTSQSTGLFNVNPDKVNVTQAWMYAERVADGSEGFDWGFRVDMMYGVDAFTTQAFGNPEGTWDYLNGWDYGIYGWALPQLYGEVAYGDWSVKAGHFYTIIGYEVVTAPDNFFYSHALTMFNSEPFTHTGVLATGNVTDNLTVYAGWTLGWDTGFSQFEQGNNWLGGFSYALSEDVTFTYASVAGNFGWRGRDAYMQSVVLDMNVTEKLNYVFQSDLLRTELSDVDLEDTFGINQYLFYSISDRLALGTRIEWWKADTLTDFRHTDQVVLPVEGNVSYYEWTAGVNYFPTANFRVRPEIRYDWVPGANYTEWIFGMDGILTF
jgi:hypothetical protein